ncbi:hypothetical protein ACP3V3_01865 [Vibrio sp. PNB22_3_1]
MALFHTTIALHCGETYRTIDQFIEADNQDDAQYHSLALKSCNTTLNRQEFDDNKEWWDGESVLVNVNCNEIVDPVSIGTLSTLNLIVRPGDNPT